MRILASAKSSLKWMIVFVAQCMARCVSCQVVSVVDTSFDQGVARLQRRKGSAFVVQVGAYDGVSGDPIREHILRWHLPGLLIEPQPDVFRQLLRNYASETQLKFENSLVSDRDGKSNFFVVRPDSRAPATIGARSSLDRQKIVQCKSLVPQIESLIYETELPAMTFASVFQKHGVRAVDILIVDAEGYDARILEMFDFAHYQPAIVLFEHSHLSFAEYWTCLRRLVRVGYRFEQLGENTLALKDQMNTAVEGLGHAVAASASTVD